MHAFGAKSTPIRNPTDDGGDSKPRHRDQSKPGIDAEFNAQGNAKDHRPGIRGADRCLEQKNHECKHRKRKHCLGLNQHRALQQVGNQIHFLRLNGLVDQSCGSTRQPGTHILQGDEPRVVAVGSQRYGRRRNQSTSIADHVPQQREQACHEQQVKCDLHHQQGGMEANGFARERVCIRGGHIADHVHPKRHSCQVQIIEREAHGQ